MRIALLILAFAGLLALSTQAQAKDVWDTHPEWFTCQEDNQCALFCEACGNVSVNKKSADHAKDVKPICKSSIPCLPEAKAQCLDNRCSAVIDKREDEDDKKDENNKKSTDDKENESTTK